MLPTKRLTIHQITNRAECGLCSGVLSGNVKYKYVGRKKYHLKNPVAEFSQSDFGKDPWWNSYREDN